MNRHMAVEGYLARPPLGIRREGHPEEGLRRRNASIRLQLTIRSRNTVGKKPVNARNGRIEIDLRCANRPVCTTRD